MMIRTSLRPWMAVALGAALLSVSISAGQTLVPQPDGDRPAPRVDRSAEPLPANQPAIVVTPSSALDTIEEPTVAPAPEPLPPVAPDRTPAPEVEQAAIADEALLVRQYVPVVTSHSCGLRSEEQAVFTLLAQADGQRRGEVRCSLVLAQVARARAEDMARRRYVSHTNPDGIGPNFLVRVAGYPLPVWYSAELAANNIESIAAGASTPEGAWQLWMGSPGHRTHLLGLHPFWAEQRDVGVGYAFDPASPYRHYWVVITAREN